MTETALLSHLVGVPWIIHAPALQTLTELAQRHAPDPANLESWKALMAPAQPEAVAFREAQPMPGARRAMLRDGVAIIPVSGPIFRYANLFTEMSGATSLQAVANDLQLAADDTRIRGIVLNIDSPGGQANGIAEVAAAIREVTKRKPVVAYVDGLAASAGYWLAAAASEVVLGQTAIIGSLGAVVVAPPKRPGQPEPVEIVSSQTPNKRADPHTDAGRVQIQMLVDRLAEEFLAGVAAFRGLQVSAVIDGSRGGGLLVGRDAVAARLADRLGSFEETLARLAAGDAGGAAGAFGRPALIAPAASQDGAHMAENDTPPPAATAEPPAPANPALTPLAALIPGATAADARAEERARCAAIFAAASPGFEQLAQLAVSQGWTAETFAQAQAAAQAGVQAANASAYAGSFPAPVQTAPAAPPAPPADPVKAEWDGDAKLRAEFGGDFDSFKAFKAAEAAGRARIKRA